MHANHPLVSVIVPVYNAEAYLSACLESIFRQTMLHEIEVVAVDDGSTDGSRAILDEYAACDGRLRVVGRENGGLSAARNTGIENAKGDYLMFVDADDEIHPHCVEVLYDVLQTTNSDVACGRYIYAESFDFRNVPSVATGVKRYTPEEAISDTLYQKHGFEPSACCKLYKRTIFNDLRFAEGKYYEDLEIICKVYDWCKSVAVCSNVLYFYRDNGTSFINSYSRSRLDVLEVTRSVEEYIREKHPALVGAALDRRLSANFNMFAVSTAAGWHDEAEACWDYVRRHRLRTLLDVNTRFKSKAGAIASYLGKRFFLMLYKG